MKLVQIIKTAEVIKRKLTNSFRLESFSESETVIIRWNTNYKKYGESNAAIEVPSFLVKEIVEKYLQDKLQEDKQILNTFAKNNNFTFEDNQ